MAKKNKRARKTSASDDPSAGAKAAATAGSSERGADAGRDRGGAGDSGSRPDAAGPDAAHRIEVPGWLPPVLYAIATLGLFRAFVVSGDMLFGSDTLGLGYMARAFYADALAAGDFPLWNPIILGGTPFLDSLAGGDSLYPPSVLLLMLLEPYRALGWKLVLHVFLAGLFMFGWLRSLGISRASATVVGLAYLLAPFMVTLVWPGHDGKIFVTALTPLLFWCSEKALTRRGLRWDLALAAAIGAVILTTHFQMAYFVFGALGCYYVFRVVQVGRIRGNWRVAGGRFALFLAAAVVGAGVAAVQLVPAVSYVTEHSRRTATTTEASAEEGIAYSSSWSLHPEEIASLVVPEFVGGNVGGADWTDETYWGRNLFKHNHEYAGLLVLILAGLSFFGGTRPALRRFFLAAGFLALLYALGRHTPVWRVFYEVVPGISLFRVPSIAIFLFGFSAMTLAAFGLDRVLVLFTEPAVRWRAPQRYLWIWVGALGALTVLWASGALPYLWTSLVYSEIGPRAEVLERARPLISRGFFVATLLAGALAGVLALGRRGSLGAGLTAALVGLLLVADAIRVDDSYIQTIEPQRVTQPDRNEAFLMAQSSEVEPWRLLSMVSGGQDVRPGTFGIELAGGHHPNDLARYRELTGMVGSGTPDNLLRSPQLLSLLNVRYLLWPELQFGPPFGGAQPVSAVTLSDGRVYTAVYELPTLPRARLVGSARVVAEDQIVAAMLEEGFDPSAEVLLDAPPGITLDGMAPTGSVSWRRRGADAHELTVTTDRDALLVIADNWFPDWRATVNGVEAPVLRAYHTLRAVPVPAGTSEVRMAYDGGRIRRSLWITLGSVLLLAVGAVVVVQRERDGKAEKV